MYFGQNAHFKKITVASYGVVAHFVQKLFLQAVTLPSNCWNCLHAILRVDLTSEASAHLKDALFGIAVSMPLGKLTTNYVVFVKLWLRHVCD